MRWRARESMAQNSGFVVHTHKLDMAALRREGLVVGAGSQEAALLARVLRGETSPRELDGLTHEAMDARYREASAHFADGRFEQAREAFSWLTANEPREAAYWVALGCTEQALGEHAIAARSYAAAAMLDAQNPAPHLYAAECLAAQGHVDAARLAAMGALEVADGRREHAAVAAGAVLFLGRLSAGEVR